MKKYAFIVENNEGTWDVWSFFGDIPIASRKERVENELEEFLSYEFFPRFGWGCGLTRLARAWELMMVEKEQEVY